MWWNSYVGLPYKSLGSTRDGADCWGLLVLIQKEVFGRDLPVFNEIRVGALRGETDNVPLFTAVLDRVNDVQSGDVVHCMTLVAGKLAPLHVGIVTKPGFMIHVYEGATALIHNYNATAYHNRVINILRPK